MSASSETRQFKTIRGGGASTGLSPAMPSFEEIPSKQQIRGALAYVRATFIIGTTTAIRATN